MDSNHQSPASQTGALYVELQPQEPSKVQSLRSRVLLRWKTLDIGLETLDLVVGVVAQRIERRSAKPETDG